jgi:hypothetical protein
VKFIYRGLVCSLLLLLCFSCSKDGVPYAPWAKFAEKPPGIFKARVLNKTEVPVPPFPNAYLSSVGVLSVDNHNYETLVVNLLTAEDEGQVIAFYKDRLLNKGEWNYDKALGIFFQGKTMTEAVIHKKCTVKITWALVESTDTIYIEKDFLKQMKTRIRIVFTLTEQ